MFFEKFQQPLSSRGGGEALTALPNKLFVVCKEQVKEAAKKFIFLMAVPSLKIRTFFTASLINPSEKTVFVCKNF